MKNLEGTVHMQNFRRFLTISAVLALSRYGVAYAQGVNAGTYQIAVGRAAPCPVTLAADGTAVVDATCKASFVHWQSTPTGIELLHPNGDVYAPLTAKGG